MRTGIDISSHQTGVDFAQVKASGRDFVLVKATEGTSYRNPSYEDHVAQARAAGLVVGAYHFARPRLGDPSQQVAWFKQVAGTVDLVALDLEDGTGDLTEWAIRFLNLTEAAFSLSPAQIYYYSGAWFHHAHVRPDARLARWRLWWAAYQDAPPPAPEPWVAVDLWQHSSSAQVPGVPGDVDENIAFVELGGDMAWNIDMKRLAILDLRHHFEDWPSSVASVDSYATMIKDDGSNLLEVRDAAMQQFLKDGWTSLYNRISRLEGIVSQMTPSDPNVAAEIQKLQAEMAAIAKAAGS